jgi:hypothetical protein
LPLNYVKLVGSYTPPGYTGASGVPPAGTVIFVPSQTLSDTADHERVPQDPVIAELVNGQFTVELLATDNPNLAPAGWGWTITESIGALPASQWSFFLPYAGGATQYLDNLTPTQDVIPGVSYLETTGGTMSGPLTIDGAFTIPAAAAAGRVWTAQTSNGLGAWQAAPVLSVNAKTGAVTLTASDVGADPSGAASAAQTAAEQYAAGLQPTPAAPQSLLTGGTGVSAASNSALLGALGALPLAGGTMTGPLNMGGAKVTNLGNGGSAQDAVAYGQLGTAAFQPASAFDAAGAASAAVATETTRAEAAEALLAPLASPALTGTPTAPTPTGSPSAAQIATVGYVQATAQGLDGKPSANALAASNITLSGTQTVDGVALAAGMRCLATGQATASQNGLWVVASGAWVRPTDFASGSTQQGSYVFIEAGTAYGSSGWFMSGGAAVTVDTSSQTWTQFSGAGEITAGTGLVKTGNTLSVVPDSTTSDIAASPGTAAAGSVGKPPDAGHVHPQPAMFAPTGLTGATAASRYVGATASGAPASGTFSVGDWVIDQTGLQWICTVAGSPGTWVSSAAAAQAAAEAASLPASLMTTLGDTLYEGSSGAARLAGNTAASKKFLTQTGTGSASAPPAWGGIAAGDLPAGTTSAQGALQLDGTASDIQPTGTAASAGNKGQAADAKHVHVQDYLGVFGDGSDGTLTFDGTSTVAGLVPSSSTYTMTRDLFATNLTINNGVTLAPAGYRIFCQGTFTNNGTVSAAGNAGAASGSAGSSTGSGSLGGGKGGGSGTTTTGNAGNNNNAAGVNTGGAGGTGTSGNTGGAGGTAGSSSTSYFKNPGPALAGVMSVLGATPALAGGPGGGGGGGDGTNKGGGGGSGGGPVVIFAWAANNGSGTISVPGGGGGTPTAGNTGGGGGGSGGVILVYTLTAWTAGTTNVSGGSGGTAHGTGTNGGAGGAGSVLNQVLS